MTLSRGLGRLVRESVLGSQIVREPPSVCLSYRPQNRGASATKLREAGQLVRSPGQVQPQFKRDGSTVSLHKILKFMF